MPSLFLYVYVVFVANAIVKASKDYICYFIIYLSSTKRKSHNDTQKGEGRSYQMEAFHLRFLICIYFCYLLDYFQIFNLSVYVARTTQFSFHLSHKYFSGYQISNTFRSDLLESGFQCNMLNVQNIHQQRFRIPLRCTYFVYYFHKVESI